MPKIFITSDTHFSHANSIMYCGRPYMTKEEMDEDLVKRWNETVGLEDTVYHLGDVAMQAKAVSRFIPRLNGRKFLVVGNHDLVFGYFSQSRGKKYVAQMDKLYREAGFEEIYYNNLELEVQVEEGPLKIRLSHFPTAKENDPYHNSRHDGHKLQDNGLPVLCGHVHDSYLKRGNSINVGVDVWNFKPVLLSEVLKLRHFGDLNAPFPLRRFFWASLHKFLNLFKSQKQNHGKRR